MRRLCYCQTLVWVMRQAAAAGALEALLAEGSAAVGTLRVRAAPYVDAAISAMGSYGEAAAAQVQLLWQWLRHLVARSIGFQPTHV